ncbi:MAG: DUF5130 domain-containing protein [Actinomycetota bacterium]|nr:DUF5130 domain-containing protein [Actinomycetota bacterium]
MGAGELVQHSGSTRLAEDPDHGYGSVVTASGRVSVASEKGPAAPGLPFSPVQLTRLDEALTLSARSTGLSYSIYLGALGENPRERAEELHTSIGSTSSESVLIAVSPGQRKVEIVTGDEAARRIPSRGCNLAVMSMVASFKEGDLTGGLVSALRMLSDQAGKPVAHR